MGRLRAAWSLISGRLVAAATGRRGPTWKRLRRAVGRAALALATAALVAAAVVWFTSPVDRADLVRPRDAITVIDRSGAPLRHARSEGLDRRWVDLDRVSPHLVSAVLSIEDERFYGHPGIDPVAMARAAIFNVLPGHRLSGASTITQQLVKLIYGRPHGLWSKPSELARALRLESMLSKDEILEQYLNRLPFGDQIVGVARASEEYFGHPASELTVSEAALLAGIPQAPSVTEPRRHLQRALARRRLVLARMHETGRLDEAAYRAALEEAPVIRDEAARPWRAPRFVDSALERWRRGDLRREGPVLRTSLDLPLQREAETVVRRAVERLAPRGVGNGAAVVVDNATGEILAYVGAARQGPTFPGGQMDLLRAPRQPGSTLKPFVYELLFEQGGTAATVLDDLSRPMTGAGETIFEARDYDGEEQGPVRARAALARSLNLAALDAARRVGEARIVERLRALGVGRLESPDHYGAAVVLGGADLTPLELAHAYVTLARGGTRIPFSYAAGGSIGVEPVAVMDPGAAAVTIDVLSDPRARADGFGDDLTALFDDVDEELGLKTGTSTGWHDAWAAVFTDRITVVVWLGDPGRRPMGAVSGFDGAARPAVTILAAAHRRADALRLAGLDRELPTLVPVRICAHTGLLSGDRCTHTVEERFVNGTLPTRRCEAHLDDGTWVVPRAYARWVGETHPAGVTLADSIAARPEATLRIVHPAAGARWLLDARRGATLVPLRAELDGAAPPGTSWEVDGAAIAGDRWPARSGRHRFVAVWQGRRSDPVEVEVVETGI